jgi:hypothetical protein
MITPVSNATQAQPPVQSKPATQAAPQAKQQTAPTDTVTISAAKQIVQESLENSVQTAKEAAGGDLQAKRLLAREAADRVTTK